MEQARRILLVGSTEQPKSAALQRAVALATAAGTPLHIAVLIEPFLTYTLLSNELKEQIRQSMLNEQRRIWTGEVEHLRERGLQATFCVTWADNLHQEILCQVRELQPVMLVKDVQREPSLKRSFVTPLDWHLLRSCPIPLHLVNGALHPKPRVVLAAVDLTEPDAGYSGLNDEIIKAGFGLAAKFNAELRLLYIFENMPAYISISGEAVADWAEVSEELRAAMHQSFVRLADLYGIPQDRRHFLIGKPITSIIEFTAEHHVDVVVMGRSHRKILDKWLGSTTEAVLHRTSGSVLIIPQEVA